MSIEDSASLLSRGLFRFLNPLYAIGSKRTLEHEDLGPCAKQDKSNPLFTKFSIHYAAEEIKPFAKRSLWMVLWRTVGWMKVFCALLLYSIYASVGIGPILILSNLVQHLQGTTNYSPESLWTMVVLMLMLPIIASLSFANSNVIMAHVGIEFRNVLVNAIYRKSLRLSPSSRQSSSTGQIVNVSNCLPPNVHPKSNLHSSNRCSATTPNRLKSFCSLRSI